MAAELHGFDGMLMTCAESAEEWQELRHMPMSDAAAWVAARRVTPS